MDENAISQYILTSLPGAEMLKTDDGTSFFFLGAERMMPVATLVTNDAHDTASNLQRPGVFRLNIGVSKATFVALFGRTFAAPGESGVLGTGHDFTALDELMPHPVYGNLFWLCVLNPGARAWEQVQSLLAEAFARRAKEPVTGQTP